MYGAPFYSMPFPYPPATSGVPAEGDVGGGTSAGAEKKPGDSNGPAKSADDGSNPVRSLGA